eukprot:gene38617-50713_t
MSVNYIEQDVLANSIKNFDNSIVVIDVRGDDFAEGHIPSAIQIPSDKWDDVSVLDDIIRSQADKRTIVIHCMKSQLYPKQDTAAGMNNIALQK